MLSDSWGQKDSERNSRTACWWECEKEDCEWCWRLLHLYSKIERPSKEMWGAVELKLDEIIGLCSQFNCCIRFIQWWNGLMIRHNITIQAIRDVFRNITPVQVDEAVIQWSLFHITFRRSRALMALLQRIINNNYGNIRRDKVYCERLKLIVKK